MANGYWVALVALVFGVVTVTMMLLVVSIAYVGLGKLPTGGLQRHADALAGFAIAASGLAVLAFDL